MIVDFFNVILVACSLSNHAVGCHRHILQFDCQDKHDCQETVPYLVDEWEIAHPDVWVKKYWTQPFDPDENYL